MATNLPGSTHASLLLRVRDPGDQEAWREFVSIYAPQVFLWARRHGFQNSDAADVTQIVLGKLVRAMQTFEYDAGKGRFRGWLRTVTTNAVRSFASSANRIDRGEGGTSMNRRLGSLRAPGPLRELSGVLDQQAERDLLAAAEARIHLRVKPKNWSAWQLTVREGLSPAEAAKKLNIKPSEVYVARTRITKMLRTEIDRMGDAPGHDDG